MTSPSLFEDCQGLIEKGHESWMSYFNKWETVAKYDEDILENHVDNISQNVIKSSGKKNKIKLPHMRKRKTARLIKCRKNQGNKKITKKKQVVSKKDDVNLKQDQNYLDDISQAIIKTTDKKTEKKLPRMRKRKAVQLIKYKKNQRNRKKIIKKKQTLLKRPDTNLEECKEKEDKVTEMLETNLKIFFNNFLRENKSKVEIFSILAFSSSQESNFQNSLFNHQQALYFQLNKETTTCASQKTVCSNMSNMNVSSVSSVRNTCNEYLSRQSLNSPICHPHPVTESGHLKGANNHALFDRYHKFELCYKNKMNTTSKIDLSGKSNFFPRTPTHESSELKPLEWDLSHKSPVSVSRKINKEYFIKRTFPKMNITLDEKRFRNLCLHKRTNSVSLSMENSNFTTPERKPPERKCFTENVLQRKRRCPSKLFFDNEEDSESDDQTEHPRPLIRCQNKKLKTQIIAQVLDSDSDEYESIFDRVEQS